ncbi:hypothetical protein D3C81_2285910 [compost metagenome]
MEYGRLLLKTAGIAHHQEGTGQQINHVRIFDGIQQMNPLMTPQYSERRFPDGWA